jgi:hypothetical protein
MSGMMVQPGLVSNHYNLPLHPTFSVHQFFATKNTAVVSTFPFLSDLDPSNFFFSKNKIILMKVLFAGCP